MVLESQVFRSRFRPEGAGVRLDWAVRRFVCTKKDLRPWSAMSSIKLEPRRLSGFCFSYGAGIDRLD